MLQNIDTPTRAVAPGPATAGRYLGPATILEINEADQLVLVQWEKLGKPCLSWARPALGEQGRCRTGSRALVLSEDLQDFYILGILGEVTSATSPLPHSVPVALATSSGANAVLAHSAGAEVLRVHSKKGALVLEYHPETGKTQVNIEQGDLEFIARTGSISFRAAKTISFAAHRLESVAETVVAKAKNLYRTVEELAQLQTGRLRILVQKSCHLKARDANLLAEEDFKVDGKQIHLG